MNKKIDCNIVYSFAFAFSFILIFSFILKTLILIIFVAVVVAYFSIANKINFKNLNTQIKSMLNCLNSEKVNNFSREVLDVYKTPEKINQNKINIDKKCFNSFSDTLFTISFFIMLFGIVSYIFVMFLFPKYISALYFLLIVFSTARMFSPNEKILDFIFLKKLNNEDKCFNKQNYKLFKKNYLSEPTSELQNNNTFKKEETITLKEKLENYNPSKDKLKKEEFEYNIDDKKLNKDFSD